MNHKIDAKQLRSFGLTVGGIFAVIGLWPALFRGEGPRQWVLILAACLLVPALLFPKSLRPAYRIWMALGHALGWINTRLILSILYYSVFTPMGLALRLLGKDPMRRKFEPAATTYRVMRRPRPSSHMTHQF